jgi:hypothetical protein
MSELTNPIQHITFDLEALIGERVKLRITTNSRDELASALNFFGLANPTGATAPAEETKAEETKAEETKAKKPKVEKAAAPAAKTEAPAAKTEAPAAAAETPAATTDAPKATVEQAAEAVRAFGAKKGIVAARELLQKHGFGRTSEITADKAGLIVAEASAE